MWYMENMIYVIYGKYHILQNWHFAKKSHLTSKMTLPSLLTWICYFYIQVISSKYYVFSYFKWRHNTSTGKSPLLSWKVFTWIMMKTCVLYTSHKIHLILKFIEIDEASVNLLHNYSKSGRHSFKNFNNSRKLYIWCFNPCYHNLPMRICSCVCICW